MIHTFGQTHGQNCCFILLSLTNTEEFGLNFCQSELSSTARQDDIPSNGPTNKKAETWAPSQRTLWSRAHLTGVWEEIDFYLWEGFIVVVALYFNYTLISILHKALTWYLMWLNKFISLFNSQTHSVQILTWDEIQSLSQNVTEVDLVNAYWSTQLLLYMSCSYFLFY